MKHQFPIKICSIVMIIILAACSKENAPTNPAPRPGTPPSQTTELSVLVQQWQYIGGNTYLSVFTNLISTLNTSNGKVSVYVEVDGAYKKINQQPIEYAEGMLSASVSQTDLTITFHKNQVGTPPQNLPIKVIVEK